MVRQPVRQRRTPGRVDDRADFEITEERVEAGVANEARASTGVGRALGVVCAVACAAGRGARNEFGMPEPTEEQKQVADTDTGIAQMAAGRADLSERRPPAGVARSGIRDEVRIEVRAA